MPLARIPLINRLPPNRQKVNVFAQDAHSIRCDVLTSRLRVRTIRLNLSDFVGQHRGGVTPWQIPLEWTRVSRRTVLKGIAGAAGLVSIPAIIAACSSTWQRRPRRARRPAASAATECAGSVGQRRERRHRLRHVRVELSSRTPTRRPCRPSSTLHRQDRHRGQGQHVDHNTFQDQISTYLQGTPDDVFTWFAGYRMRFFADRASRPTSTTSGPRSARNYSDAFKAVLDGQRRQAVLRPVLQLPVGRHLPQERLRREGLHGPQDDGTSSRPSATR